MSLTILHGDAIEKLCELPSESVQCCVTSPPYWGLRDYGTATWEGGENECDHKAGSDYGTKNDTNSGAIRGGPFRQLCGKCGAKRIDAQIGLEDTPDAYVAKIVEVFREVRRVLRNDGTLWLNLGDTYNNNLSGPNPGGIEKTKASIGVVPFQRGRGEGLGKVKTTTLKPKDLCGIPWRVAFALQADGWYLRSDIIWHKPNPMPESVTDRPTKAHEYLFLLSKNERYYYDADAIREPHSEPWRGNNLCEEYGGHRYDGYESEKFVTRWKLNNDAKRQYNPLGRNKRTVWTVVTAPYAEAHFATFPPDLIKPCILAGTKAGDTVLDPFGGSGTTGMVAIELGRKAILVELNAEYLPLIEQRCNITPGFAL